MRARLGPVAVTLTLGIAVLVALSPALAASNRRPSDAERGQEIYERSCLACHGEFGRGDGPATADLVQPVPSMEGLVTKSNVNDHVQAVLIGKGRMPGFEASFDRYDARRVLRHLARVANNPVPEPEPEPAVDGDTDPPDADAATDGPTDAPPESEPVPTMVPAPVTPLPMRPAGKRPEPASTDAP